jgi:acyl-CoA thioester hydrolase
VTYKFSYEMPVRFADTDAQGHVFFANYFTFCDEALSGYMRAIGMPWQSLVDSGVDMFYASAQCDFKGPAKFEDTLAIGARLARFGRTSMEFELEIRVADSDSLVAVARLVSVCVDTAKRTPVAVPRALREAIETHESSRT